MAKHVILLDFDGCGSDEKVREQAFKQVQAKAQAGDEIVLILGTNRQSRHLNHRNSTQNGNGDCYEIFKEFAKQKGIIFHTVSMFDLCRNKNFGHGVDQVVEQQELEKLLRLKDAARKSPELDLPQLEGAEQTDDQRELARLREQHDLCDHCENCLFPTDNKAPIIFLAGQYMRGMHPDENEFKFYFYDDVREIINNTRRTLMDDPWLLPQGAQLSCYHVARQEDPRFESMSGLGVSVGRFPGAEVTYSLTQLDKDIDGTGPALSAEGLRQDWHNFFTVNVQIETVERKKTSGCFSCLFGGPAAVREECSFNRLAVTDVLRAALGQLQAPPAQAAA